jgi:hypothetical protein
MNDSWYCAINEVPVPVKPPAKTLSDDSSFDVDID